MNFKKKIKRSLISLVGVSIAIALLVGGNLNVPFKAFEANLEINRTNESILENINFFARNNSEKYDSSINFSENNNNVDEELPYSDDNVESSELVVSVVSNESDSAMSSTISTSSSTNNSIQNSDSNSIISSSDNYTSNSNDISSATSSSANSMEDFQKVSPFATTVIDSGIFGDVAWSLDSEGTLVFGDGTFPNNNSPDTLPWNTYFNSIKKVNFTDTIYAAPQSAYLFSNLSVLEEINGLNLFNTENVVNMDSMFRGTADVQLDLSTFDTSQVTQMNYMFSESGFTSLDLSAFKTSSVTKMDYMFNKCGALATVNLSGWDTSKVENFRGMFSECAVLDNLDISHFVTTSATNMGYMFSGCKTLSSLDVSNFVTDSVTDMSYMFSYCQSVPTLDVSGFNTSNVTNMAYMFRNCVLLNQIDVSDFFTTNVTDMKGMFARCDAVTALAVDNFDTVNVADMSYMFSGCKSLPALNVADFNTSKVANFSYMFNGCKLLTTIDVSKFDTGEAKNTAYMFNSCENVTSLDVSNFVTDYVEDMSYMFSACKKITTINTTNFNTEQVKNMKGMFDTCESLISLDVSGFSTANVIDMSYMFRNCYILPTIDVSGFQTGNVKDMTAMFARCDSVTALDVSDFVTTNVISMKNMFSGCKLVEVLDVSNFDTANVTDISLMFNNCEKVQFLNVSNFVTDKVTDMSYMFSNCYLVPTIDVSNFKTENVTSMQAMFNGCKTVQKLEVAGFDTQEVTNMSRMFDTCESLTSLDISGFSTANVTDMSYMFRNCFVLPVLNVTNFITAKVTNMASMFARCEALQSLDVTNFNTSNVTNMSYMFSNCIKVTDLDITNFNTSKVQTMDWMLAGIWSMPTIDLSNLDTKNVTNMQCIFYNSHFETLDLTPLNTSKASASSIVGAEGTTSGTAKMLSRTNYLKQITVSSSFSLANSGLTDSPRYTKRWRKDDNSKQFVDSATFISTFDGSMDAGTYLRDPITPRMFWFNENWSGGVNVPPFEGEDGIIVGSDVVMASITDINERPGYILLGWNSQSNGLGTNYPIGSSIIMPDVDMMVYAQWQAAPQTIHFDGNAANAENVATDITPVTDSSYDLTTVTEPTRSGYEFIGWYDAAENGTQITTITVPAGGATYYAYWKALPQTIHFDGNASDAENVPVDITLDTDSSYDLTTVTEPTRAGYEFIGWYDADKNGTQVTTITVPAGGVTYYAYWKALPQTIHFDGNALDAEDVPADITLDTDSSYDLTTLTEPTRAGYEFIGWYDADENGTQVTTITVPVGGVTYYAYWKALSQTIHFDGNALDAEDVPADITLDTDSSYDLTTLTEPTRPGYNFAGWYDADENGTQITTITVPAGGATYYAYWQPQGQFVRFHPNGNNVSNLPTAISANTGDSVSLAGVTSPTRIGYSFVNWYDSETNGSVMPSSITMVAGGKDFYAQWQAYQYTIQFDGNGKTSGIMSDQLFIYDSFQNLSKNEFVKDGYVFDGWNTEADGSGVSYIDKESILNLSTVENDTITLYAQWEGERYTVQFDGNGAQKEANPLSISVKVPNNILTTLPSENPERKGYTFVEWNSQKDGNGEKFTENTIITEDITVYAKWEHKAYQVTYVSYDLSTTIASYTLYVGDKIPHVNGPNVGGHHFVGWGVLNTEDKWDFYNPMPAYDLTLVALYDKNMEETSSSSVGSSKDGAISTNNSDISSSLSKSGAISSIEENINSAISSESVVISFNSDNNSHSQDIISQNSVPLSTIEKENQNWSLIGLILTSISIIMGAILLILGLKKKNITIIGVISAIVGILSMILFLLLNNLNSRMVWFNMSTILFIIIVVIQIILLFLVKRKNGADNMQNE